MSSKEADLNPTISIILFSVNGLKTPMKKVKLPELIKAARKKSTSNIKTQIHEK